MAEMAYKPEDGLLREKGRDRPDPAVAKAIGGTGQKTKAMLSIRTSP